jgi:hypothetical protein
MKMTLTTFGYGLATWCVLCISASGAEWSAPLGVAEPAGIERIAEPASGGVPFKPGQVKDVAELALFTKDWRQVPAQFSKLAGYEDGSVQWALADFMTDLPANGKADFVVKSGKTGAPAKALEIVEKDALITVNTGVAKFTINKDTFRGLESAEVGGEGTGGPGAIELSDGDGKVFHAGKPTKAVWEYRGPIRSTLRVDGPYVDDDGKPYIDYTVRLTFWGGTGLVRMDHSIRNSNPNEGNDAKIKWAKVTLGAPAEGAEQEKGEKWVAAGTDKAGLRVSYRHTGGCFPGGGKTELGKIAADGDKVTVWSVPEGTAGKGMFGYGQGFFALADCAHKDTEIWAEFYPGKMDAKANEAKAKALNSKLHALADGKWISETEALGSGHFGTLEDEIACYRKWGWKGADDPKKLKEAELAHIPDAYVSTLGVHFETEADTAELDMLMYVRTGQRGFFDRGESFARFYKTHYTFRTDGFIYDGFKYVAKAVSDLSKRACKGLNFGWTGPRDYMWGATRWCECHYWGSGVFDYYCLTGDVDALEAGLDMAEISDIGFSRNIGFLEGNFMPKRGWGRNFRCVLRAHQVMRDAKWKQVAERFAKTPFKGKNFDPVTGLFSDPRPNALDMFIETVINAKPGKKESRPLADSLREYMKEKGITMESTKSEVTMSQGRRTWKLWNVTQHFEFAVCAEALARYAEIFNDAEARIMVMNWARGTRDVYWSKKCDAANAITHGIVIGLPEEGKAYDPGMWDPEHKGCPGDNAGEHSGYPTRFMTVPFVFAYSASGDKSWLELAKHAWDRGSKRGFKAKVQMPADEVGFFAGHKPPNGAGVDIRNAYRLFYEAARAESK